MLAWVGDEDTSKLTGYIQFYNAVLLASEV